MPSQSTNLSGTLDSSMDNETWIVSPSVVRQAIEQGNVVVPGYVGSGLDNHGSLGATNASVLFRLTDLREVRFELEGTALASAAMGVDAATIARMEEELARTDQAISAGDAKQCLQANPAVYFAAYRDSGSQTLVRLIEILWLQIAPCFNLLRGSGNYVLANGLHGRMAEARRRGDAAIARAAIAGDIGGSFDVLSNLLG